MSNWPGDFAPKFHCELVFSLARGMPISSTQEYADGGRTSTIRTRLVAVDPPSLPTQAK
jgi:hypothetical protein